MASQCVSPIRGLAMRASRINQCGAPVTGGDTDSAASCGFVSIGLSAQIDDGNAIFIRTASGAVCVNEPSCRVFQRYDVTIEFCQADPELFELLTGNRIITNYAGDSVGYTIGENIQCEGGFALEVWSGVAGADCGAGVAGSWWYWLLPWITSGVIGGDITIEDGPVSFTFTGRTKSNKNWGRGPYLVVDVDSSGTPGRLDAPGVVAGEHLYARVVHVAPPDCACGYTAA